MRFRAPSLEDAPEVSALLVARDIADFGRPDYTLEDLLDEWRGSDVRLDQDAVVVENDDGEIAAYALLRRPGALAVVAPAHEGRGIGLRLLAWTEQRARERGRDSYRQWTAAGNREAMALLVGAGYTRSRSYWRMVRELQDAPPTIAVPEGIRLRPLEADRDAVALHALDDLSFSANPDYSRHTLQEFTEEHLQPHDLSAELSTVAEVGDLMVGFQLTRRWQGESVGYVDVLGVHPEHRGRGLGAALLLDAFARFAAVGLREAQLGVASDNPRALRLYERVGMHPRFQVDVYERPVEMS
jgi:mycothiol synthase